VGKFDPHLAVKYAWQNFGNGHRNPGFPQTDNGNDCTNFVSQCMFAGGWTMVQGFRHYFAKRDTSVWWCDTGLTLQSGDMSWSWGGAPEFAKFLLNRKRGVELWKTPKFDLEYARKLQPGDVLGQASGGSYDELGHLCIVLEVFNDPNKSLIAQHSGNKGSPVSFKRLEGDKKVWYAWRMHRNYPDLTEVSRGTITQIKGDYIPYIHR
jgi:hypothetical protein